MVVEAQVAQFWIPQLKMQLVPPLVVMKPAAQLEQSVLVRQTEQFPMEQLTVQVVALVSE